MEKIDIFKALANETRLNILTWLKEPEKYFPEQGIHLPEGVLFEGGVCVGDIQEKAHISQSTISQYLSMMQHVGLLESVRHGQWTYYRRNEQTLAELAEYFRHEI